MAKKTVKVVETEVKTKVAKVDYKALAESIEKAFKTSKEVDVVADTSKENPNALSESDYRYIHFYKAGTEKNIFGCYLIGKGKVRFALNLAVEQFLDKDLTVKPVLKKRGEEKKKTAVDVICDIQDAPEVAQKILEAYKNIPAKEKKPTTEKAKTTVKKATQRRTAKKAKTA